MCSLCIQGKACHWIFGSLRTLANPVTCFPLGEVVRSTKMGAFPMWSPCRGAPSRTKLALNLHIKGPSYESPDRCEARLYGFCCHRQHCTGARKGAHHNPRDQRARQTKTLGAKAPSILRTFSHPSEPARSVGKAHRSARSARTIEPGRRRRLNPPAFGNTVCLMSVV